MTIPKRLREEFSDKEFAEGYVDEFLNMRIATQLKVLREQRQLTQQRLAELADMKQERISVLENVNYSSWSINTLRKLAAALDVTLKVSFETYGSCVSEMDNFTREALERISREVEIKLDQKIENAGIAPPYYEYKEYKQETGLTAAPNGQATTATSISYATVPSGTVSGQPVFGFTPEAKAK
jgi:transcriptional regulator with XRE-family HTH domain